MESRMKVSVNPKRIKEPENVTRGLMLHRDGQWSEAMNVYGDILRRHPKHAVVLYLMGLLFESVNDQHRAWDLLNQACTIKPNFTEAWYNRGVVELWLGRIADARASYEKALRLDPTFAPAWVNLGNVLMAQGDHDAAIRAYDKTSELRPDTPEGVHNRSFVFLVRGQWAEGWRDYEERWKLIGHVAANQLPAYPWWSGEPLDSKTILLVQEQGAGDTFMMLRYVPLLQEMGATVILRIPTSMETLVAASFPEAIVSADPNAGVAGARQDWPAADYVLPMMSLPGRFGTMPDTVPLRGAPYLVAPSEGPALPPARGFRVAFAWKGSKDHKNDRNRSTPLSAWLPVLTVPGVEWVCLQQEMTDAERIALGKLPNVTHVPCSTWGDTAHVLGQVEALVSIDSGICHVAGAMGVPTCILIASPNDYRWLLQRRDTAWYANSLLYRQPTAGNWTTPLAEITARLRAIVHDHERRAA